MHWISVVVAVIVLQIMAGLCGCTVGLIKIKTRGTTVTALVCLVLCLAELVLFPL
jgi:hypothetical protein